MITSKAELNKYLHQDAVMNGFISKSGGVRLYIRIFNPQYKFLRLLRFVEYYKGRRDKIIGKLMYAVEYYRFKRISMKLGYSIEPGCFGPGLSLPHYGTIVVNGASRIGANCRLHCCTNIGASAGEKTAPQIGDNCYIGPGAIIFGDINIPDNTTIGANATVNRSFNEEHTAIAGTPAKVVKTDMKNWMEFNKVNADTIPIK